MLRTLAELDKERVDMENAKKVIAAFISIRVNDDLEEEDLKDEDNILEVCNEYLEDIDGDINDFVKAACFIEEEDDDS